MGAIHNLVATAAEAAPLRFSTMAAVAGRTIIIVETALADLIGEARTVRARIGAAQAVVVNVALEAGGIGAIDIVAEGAVLDITPGELGVGATPAADARGDRAPIGLVMPRRTPAGDSSPRPLGVTALAVARHVMADRTACALRERIGGMLMTMVESVHPRHRQADVRRDRCLIRSEVGVRVELGGTEADPGVTIDTIGLLVAVGACTAALAAQMYGVRAIPTGEMEIGPHNLLPKMAEPAITHQLRVDMTGAADLGGRHTGILRIGMTDLTADAGILAVQVMIEADRGVGQREAGGQEQPDDHEKR